MAAFDVFEPGRRPPHHLRSYAALHMRSILGPILFLLYTADLLQLLKRFQRIPHAYADDTQIFGSCKPSSVDVVALVANVSDCTAEVSSVMDVIEPTTT